MNTGEPQSKSPSGSPPISNFATPTAELIAQGALEAPDHPGSIAKIEHLDVLRLLGAGGMGLVFLARDTRTGGKVAVKMLRPEFAIQPRLVHRFITEARHLQKLQHPHVVPVLSVSDREDAAYIVMPYYGRGSLDVPLSVGKPLPREQILQLSLELCDALNFLHTKGIIHRDIKPANVLLDDDGRARLADLGLAQTLFNDSVLNVEQTHPEGTAPYMSPAVAAGEAEDTRCDIYSFGALLYELLTGKQPYTGSTKEIIKSILAGPPRPILEINPHADKWLAFVAEGAMARTHRDRYAGTADVLVDLKRITVGEYPVGPRGRGLRRLAPRAAIVSAVILVVALGTALTKTITRSVIRLEIVQTTSIPSSLRSTGLGVCQAMNGDGRADFVFADDDAIRILSSAGELSHPISLKAPHNGPIRVTLVEDVTGDGIPETFVSWSDGQKAYTGALNQNGWPIKTFCVTNLLQVHKKYGTNNTLLAARLIADLDGDGQMELLAEVDNCWGGVRGLCCFDWKSGNPRWFFKLAPPIRGLDVVDLFGDGKKQVVLGSSSSANGLALPNGTDDSHAYIYVLSASGDLIWQTNLADHFCQAVPVHFAGEGTNSASCPGRALVWVASAPETNSEGPRVVGQILAFGADGNAVAAYDAKVQLVSCLSADVDSDGKAEVLATDKDGYLHLLNPDLTLRNKIHLETNCFTWVDLRLHTFAPFAGKGRQILLSSSQVEVRGDLWDGSDPEKKPATFYHNNSVLLLDPNLKLLAATIIARRAPASEGFPLNCFALKTPEAWQILALGKDAKFLRVRGL